MTVDQLLEQLADLVAERVARRLEAPATGAPRLVTVKEYAAARSLSQKTVRAAIRDGRLRSHRIGRAIRIAGDAVIEERRSESPTPTPTPTPVIDLAARVREIQARDARRGGRR